MKKKRSEQIDSLGFLCQECGRMLNETREPVSPDAIAYACSRCLMRLPSSKPSKQGVDSGSLEMRSVSMQEPSDPKRGFDDVTVSRRPEDQGHHGRKGGRPRKHASKAAKDRAASRAYRARSRGRSPRLRDP